jgi:hypothetical protein
MVGPFWAVLKSICKYKKKGIFICGNKGSSFLNWVLPREVSPVTTAAKFVFIFLSDSPWRFPSHHQHHKIYIHLQCLGANCLFVVVISFRIFQSWASSPVTTAATFCRHSYEFTSTTSRNRSKLLRRQTFDSVSKIFFNLTVLPAEHRTLKEFARDSAQRSQRGLVTPTNFLSFLFHLVAKRSRRWPGKCGTFGT